MVRWAIIVVLLMAGFTSIQAAHRRLDPIRFTREFSAVDGRDLNINWRETWRIEHFLHYVFPMREMERFERYQWNDAEAAGTPIQRRVDYAIVEQEGYRFVLVHFYASKNGGAGTSVLAVYRLEPDGPNQVWKSRAWQSTYPGFHFQTAKIGWRNVVLFEEGGVENGFGLAGIFTFHNVEQGLYLRVLTPEMPRLRAITRFPVRPLLARNISLSARAMHEITLAASDEAFSGTWHDPAIRHWIFNDRRGIFEVSGPGNEAVR